MTTGLITGLSRCQAVAERQGWDVACISGTVTFTRNDDHVVLSVEPSGRVTSATCNGSVPAGKDAYCDRAMRFLARPDGWDG